MESLIADVMYYLMYILAAFGLIFVLLLIVRLSLWLLKCNLGQNNPKKEQKNKQQRSSKVGNGKSKSKNNNAVNLLSNDNKKTQSSNKNKLQSAPALVKSSNAKRLNDNQEENDKQKLIHNKSATLRSQVSTCSSSSSELPPTPPPKDIEVEYENVRKNIDTSTYASLAFPKQRAPSPPATASKRSSCICPFCSSIQKTTLPAGINYRNKSEEDKDDESIKRENIQLSKLNKPEVVVILEQPIQDTQNDQTMVQIEIEKTDSKSDKSTKIAGDRRESKTENVAIVIENSLSETREEQKAEGENERNSLLMRTPSQTNSVTLCDATQSALDSLDQAIEAMDQAYNDLAVNDRKYIPKILRHSEQIDKVPESSVKYENRNEMTESEFIKSATKVTETENEVKLALEIIDTNKINENTIIHEIEQNESKIVDSKEINIILPKDEEREIQSKIDESQDTTSDLNKEEDEKKSKPEDSTETKILLEEEKTTKSVVVEVDEESEIDRRKSAPRILQSVPKMTKPVVPVKPKKLIFRATSEPLKDAYGDPIPQCAIYAQVINQIKQRQLRNVTTDTTIAATDNEETDCKQTETTDISNEQNQKSI